MWVQGRRRRRKNRPVVNFFGRLSFICESIRMSELVCVCPGELRGCYAIQLRACVLGSGRGPMAQGGGDRRRGRSRRGQRGIQCVSAHRPFLSRQTGTLKHSHTCICLCLAWGARTPTLLSWQLHKCLKWDTRQFLLQHIIANNLPCKVIINALLDM